MFAFDLRDGIAKVEDDSVLLVQAADEISHLGTEHALHRPLLQSDDMNLDLAGAQRCCDFEPDKTCADHQRAPRAAGRRDDRAAVIERTQQMDVRLIDAGDR